MKSNNIGIRTKTYLFIAFSEEQLKLMLGDENIEDTRHLTVVPHANQ